MGGDFNINLLEINNHSTYQDYLDMFITRAMYPQISLPTRFSRRRATLIDQMFCKAIDDNRAGKSAIIVSKLSDHFAMFTCIDAFMNKNHKSKYITVQEKSDLATANFVNEVRNLISNTHFNPDLDIDPNINY